MGGDSDVCHAKVANVPDDGFKRSVTGEAEHLLVESFVSILGVGFVTMLSFCQAAQGMVRSVEECHISFGWSPFCLQFRRRLADLAF